MTFDYNKEYNEAVYAGKQARASLQRALDALNSAKGWGIYDILGGGFISTMIKHSKMNDAAEYIEEAKENLSVFSRELGDIREYADVDLSTGDFWGFADWMFDDFLSDMVVQNRINEARNQVRGAIQKVDVILAGLQ